MISKENISVFKSDIQGEHISHPIQSKENISTLQFDIQGGHTRNPIWHMRKKHQYSMF